MNAVADEIAKLRAEAYALESEAEAHECDLQCARWACPNDSARAALGAKRDAADRIEKALTEFAAEMRDQAAVDSSRAHCGEGVDANRCSAHALREWADLLVGSG